MKKTFFVVLLFLLHSSCFASEVASPKAKVENFFNLLQKGNVSVAYDTLFEGSTLSTDKPQEVSLLKKQTEIVSLFGKILGYELVHEEKLSNSVVRFVYFLKSEKHPTTWEFYFYKPKSNWFLVNMMFNDQFQLLGTKK